MLGKVPRLEMYQVWKGTTFGKVTRLERLPHLEEFVEGIGQEE